MEKKLSIIIPSRNEMRNLRWTLQSLQVELADHLEETEVLCVMNKCDKEDVDRLSKYWPFLTGWARILVLDNISSCWQARNLGARESVGKYLCFLDSHVLIKTGSVWGALQWHAGWKGILHFGINYWLNDPTSMVCQYKWRRDKFWGDWTYKRPDPPDYRIFMAGMHLMVDREVFWDLGGFHPAFGVYGGGEPYLYLKAQMYGYEARCNPEFQVYHLTEQRGYTCTNEEIWFNFLLASYVLGGEEYMNPVYRAYQEQCNGHEKYLVGLEELYWRAREIGQEERDLVKIRARTSLDEIVEKHGHLGG